MNEDDTFKALRRTPFIEVFEIIGNEYVAHLRNAGAGYNTWLLYKIDTLLPSHGWTGNEYNDAVEKYKLNDGK